MLTYLGQARGGTRTPRSSTAPETARSTLPLQAFQPAPLAPRGSDCRRRCCRLRRRRRVQIAPPVVEAAPPPPPLPVAATNGHAPAAAPDIADRLLEIVSERTGYPPRDARARRRPRGRPRHRLDQARRDRGNDDPVAHARGGRHAGRRGAHVDADAARGDRGARVAQRPRGERRRSAGRAALVEGEPSPFDGARAEKPESARAHIGRYVVAAATAPPASGNAGLASDGVVVLVDDGAGVGPALAERLRARGERVVRRRGARRRRGRGRRPVARRPRRPRGGVAARSRRSPSEASPRRRSSTSPRSTRPPRRTPTATARSRACSCSPVRSAPTSSTPRRTGGAAVLGATALGGAFGIDGSGTSPARPRRDRRLPEVARPGVADGSGEGRRPRRRRTPADTADALLAELLADDGLVEVGYRDGTPDVGRAPPRAPPTATDGELPLDGRLGRADHRRSPRDHRGGRG